MPNELKENKGEGEGEAEGTAVEPVVDSTKDGKRGALETKKVRVKQLVEIPKGQELDVRPLYDNIYRLNFRAARDSYATGFDTLGTGYIIHSCRVRLVKNKDGFSLEYIDGVK